MSDDEARFARRLGLSVGRLDWWKIKGEHTPYEWALQRLAEQIDPLGPERDDMRAAKNTLQIVRMNAGEMSQADALSIYDALKNYLPFNQPDDKVLLPEEAEALKRGES